MRRGQIFLYTACTVITVNVLYTAIWNRWPVQLLPEFWVEFAPRIGRYGWSRPRRRRSSIASVYGEQPSSLGPIQNAQARSIAVETLVTRSQERGKPVAANPIVSSSEVNQQFLEATICGYQFPLNYEELVRRPRGVSTARLSYNCIAK